VHVTVTVYLALSTDLAAAAKTFDGLIDDIDDILCTDLKGDIAIGAALTLDAKFTLAKRDELALAADTGGPGGAAVTLNILDDLLAVRDGRRGV